jgi:hypothetical protein
MLKETQTEVSDVLFGGKLTPDVAELEGVNTVPSKNFDIFGASTDADEQNEDFDDDVDLEENLEENIPPTGNRKNGNVVNEELALLKQQNALLQQQMAQNQGRQISEADKTALATGQALLNMQTQNPVLYNKMNSFLQAELGGNQTPQELSVKLDSIRQLLKGDNYKTVDVKPFESILDTLDFVQGNTKKETNQLLGVINNLSAEVRALKQHNDSKAKEVLESKEDLAVREIQRAEKDFGIKLTPETQEAFNDIVLLVRNGRDPRKAFMTVFGKKETDVVQRKQKEVKVPLRGKPTGSTIAPRLEDKLSNKLFGNALSSSDIFKRKR